MTRIEIYKELRDRLINVHFAPGFCYIVSEMINNGIIKTEYDPYENLLEILPELKKYKPENTLLYDYWFKPHDRQTRIDICDKIIGINI